jgi:ribokinase
MKITTIGAALIDIYFQSEDFLLTKHQDKVFLCQSYGHKIEIASHEVVTGGAATNTAVAFARRGHEVSLIAEVGQDHFGTIVKNDLKKENISLKYLIQEKLEKTGCSVILRGHDGGRTVMVSRSASAQLDDYDIPLDYLVSRDWLHLSSIGGNLNALSELWQVFDLAAAGFSWNPGKKELLALTTGALNLPPITKGIFFANDTEWELVKIRQKDILKTFPYVVITAGGKTGQVFVSGECQYQIEPDASAPVVDETGAGDAFASAFVSTLLYQCPIEEAIQAGLNNATSVIKYVGAKQGLLSY